MKKVLALLLLTVFTAFAHAEGRIAVVNFDLAIMNSDKAKDKAKAFENRPDIKDSLEKGKAMEKEYMKLAENYKKEQELMSSDQKQAAEAKLKSLMADIQYTARKVQEEQKAFTQTPEMKRLSIVALQVAQQIVKEEGIGLLLRHNPQIVLHADTSFDITAKVTEALNKNRAL